MQKKVADFIIKNRLIDSGSIIIIGVSGGPDSMALLHIMHRLRKEMDFSILAAHINHQLRTEANDEEEFVRHYCRNINVPFFSQTVDIKKLAQREKKSIEEAGRDYRYRYFRKLAEEVDADLIATAHHQDDVAETVLLHLLRGCGIKGLRGIMPLKDGIIRPLLCLSKKEIMDYLDYLEIKYCTDKSNYDYTYLRNRIRHKLIPELQEGYNPRIVENLNQLADIAREENEVAEEETETLWTEIVMEEHPNKVVLNKNRLNAAHPAYQRRLVIKALSAFKGESGWVMGDVEKIRELAGKTGSSKRLHLRKGLAISLVYDQLILPEHLPQGVAFDYRPQIPGCLAISEIKESFEFTLFAREEFVPHPSSICLDYDKLGKDIRIRSRKPGDFFRPSGMEGRKKVKDFFIDSKIPQAERNMIPLLASSNEIYVIFGWRVSQTASIDQKTEKILVINRIKN